MILSQETLDLSIDRKGRKSEDMVERLGLQNLSRRYEIDCLSFVAVRRL